ncbi:MAG: hypothetical protein ACXQS4_02070 [Methermicoccaceae archaeon]
MNFYAQIIGKSKPLTLNEIIEQEWTIGDVEMSGLEMVLRDTLIDMEEYADRDGRIAYEFNGNRISIYKVNCNGCLEKEEILHWALHDAKDLIQSFYRRPIKWDTQKWVVLTMQKTLKSCIEPKKKLNYAHQYPKHNDPYHTTIRKPRTAEKYEVGDVVEVVVK